MTIFDTLFDYFENYFNNTVKTCSKCKQKNILSYPVTFCKKCSTQYKDVPQPTPTIFGRLGFRPANHIVKSW